MHSTEWMNQFEIKDTSIEFVINNVSRQGNKIKLKIKLHLEVEKNYRDCSSNFLSNK